MRNLKKALSLALASVMVLGMMVVGTSAKASPDVTAKHNVEAIEIVKVLGIMNGDNAGNWNPDQTLTRNELAVIVAKLADLPLNGNHPFTDVPGWASKYVGALYANGISAGTSATTYGGAQPVRTVDAALMMVRTLGYLNEKNELKDNGGYVLATTKTAQKIGLFDDVNSMITGPATRNDIAQMIVNLLNNDMVVCEVKPGANVSGNGMTVDVPATYTYYTRNRTLLQQSFDVKVDNDGDHRITTADLAKVGVADDGFGRPAVQYVYKGHTSDKVVSKNPTLTFNTELNDKELLKELGMKAADVNGKKVHVYVDGKADAAVTVNDDATKDVITGTGAGLKTEVFVNVNADNGKTDYTVTLVVTTSYVAKVDKVNPAKGDKARSITINGVSGKTFETENFAKDDVVVYTLDQRAGDTNGDIRTVELAKKQVGKLTTANTTKNLYTIAGTQYTAAADKGSFGVKGNVTKDVEFYVVNDHILGMKPVDGVVANDYALVLTKGEQDDVYNKDQKTYFAKFLLADGSVVKAEYKYDKDGDGKYVDLAANNVVKYTVDNGVYMIAKGDAKTVSESTNITANKAGIANNETVFVVAVDAKNDKYVTYTGVQNLPKYENDSKYYVAGESGKAANVVFVTKGSEAALTNQDMIYVLADNDSKNAVKGTGANGKEYTYYVYQAIVNGELTTIQHKTGSLDTGLYKAGTKDANGVYTLSDKATSSDKGVNVDGSNSVKTAGDKGVIELTVGGKKMYADNVQVFYVDAEGKLVGGSIADLTANTPVAGYLYNEQNVITTIYAGELAE